MPKWALSCVQHHGQSLILKAFVSMPFFGPQSLGKLEKLAKFNGFSEIRTHTSSEAVNL